MIKIKFLYYNCMFICNIFIFFVFLIIGVVVLYYIFKLYNIWMFNEEYVNKYFLIICFGDLD